MKITSAFTFHLNNLVETGLVCVGKYDGKRPSLTCATSGGKILVHCPHGERDLTSSGDTAIGSVTTGQRRDGDSTRFLNMNRKVTALVAGKLEESADRDVLLVGSHANILAYDVEKNADIFFEDVADGVGSILIGCLPLSQQRLVLVGGNCSIQGFDATGAERRVLVFGQPTSVPKPRIKYRENVDAGSVIRSTTSSTSNARVTTRCQEIAETEI